MGTPENSHHPEVSILWVRLWGMSVASLSKPIWSPCSVPDTAPGTGVILEGFLSGRPALPFSPQWSLLPYLFLSQIPALSSMKSGLLIDSDDRIQTENCAADKPERRPSQGGLLFKEDEDGAPPCARTGGGSRLAINMGTDSNGR